MDRPGSVKAGCRKGRKGQRGVSNRRRSYRICRCFFFLCVCVLYLQWLQWHSNAPLKTVSFICLQTLFLHQHNNKKLKLKMHRVWILIMWHDVLIQDYSFQTFVTLTLHCNGSSERSFLLYCEIHPAEMDNYLYSPLVAE